MKLYLFELGRFVFPGDPAGIPVPGYLIQTDEGRNILIDTGLSASYITDTPTWPGGSPQVLPQNYIVTQLAALGLRPTDIDQVVVTHFDIDHVGNLAPFAHAELLVQRRQYEEAHAGNPRFALARHEWDHPALRYRLLDGDTELAPGIELLESSGHVPGHQSVLVRLPHTGPVLLAIDAIPDTTLTDPDTRRINPTDADEAEIRASTRKLMAVAAREGVQLIVHGHDNAQWPTLRHAPAYYH